MEELSLNNILTGQEIDNLFTEYEETPEDNTQESNDESDSKENNTTTTEVNTDDLFDIPESVGSEDNNEAEEDTTPSQRSSSSPKFYSSIAKAFVEEGIFPDLDDERISKVESPEDFRDLIEERIKSELDERQKRIDDALNLNINTSVIKQYENTLLFLDSIDEDSLTSEDQNGELLRKRLIAQDYINRGYSNERALKAVEKSIKNGDDIEDAKEALLSNKEFFSQKYNQVIEEAKQLEQLYAQLRKEQADKLKNQILKEKNFFGDISIDNSTRLKIYDNIAKPIYKDPETGEVWTAIQKYERENRTDFLKNLGLLFTLTDGFKDLNKLIKGQVKKEVKKGLRNLEDVINSTSRNSDGSLRYTSGVDPESFIGQGWSLDI